MSFIDSLSQCDIDWNTDNWSSSFLIAMFFDPEFKLYINQYSQSWEISYDNLCNMNRNCTNENTSISFVRAIRNR